MQGRVWIDVWRTNGGELNICRGLDFVYNIFAFQCARQNKSEAQAAERSPPFALRPLTRVSCLALCPNAANACIVAVGYYNGLIRLKYLNFNGYC